MLARYLRRDLAELCHAVVDRMGSEPNTPNLTFLSNANSVPGRRQTATLFSAGEAKPRVAAPRKLVDIRVSPTFAGRDAMAWRL